jgi:hypothetical protein
MVWHIPSGLSVLEEEGGVGGFSLKKIIITMKTTVAIIAW